MMLEVSPKEIYIYFYIGIFIKSIYYFIYLIFIKYNSYFFCIILTFINIIKTAGRSLHPDLKDGGALQISLVRFQIDFYPYHLAMAGRKHWAKYRENATPHNQWLQQSLSSFRSQFMDLIDSGRTQHSPLTRSQGNVTGLCIQNNCLISNIIYN